MNHQTHTQANGYVLRFESLFDGGRALAFECDAGGHVDLDSLSERAIPGLCGDHMTSVISPAIRVSIALGLSMAAARALRLGRARYSNVPRATDSAAHAPAMRCLHLRDGFQRLPVPCIVLAS